MERKTIEVKQEDGWLIANTPGLDRDQDRVFPFAIDTQNFQKNPVIMWGHNYHDPWALIGSAVEMDISRDEFRVRPEFREPANDTDPMHIIKALWDARLIKTSSIGFIPKTWQDNDEGGRDFTEVELLEVSLVPIPANAEALRLAAKALQPPEIKTPSDEPTKPTADDIEPTDDAEFYAAMGEFVDIIKYLSEVRK